jgi:hypothetical protein
LSHDSIVVFENRLHSKSPMLYTPGLHGNWNALSLAKRALKDKFPTPTVPLTTVLPNRQVFLPNPIILFWILFEWSNEVALDGRDLWRVKEGREMCTVFWWGIMKERG